MLLVIVLTAAVAIGLLLLGRSLFIGWQGKAIERGVVVPFSFARGAVPYPAGDEFVLGLETSTWRPADPSRPPGGGPAPVGQPVRRRGMRWGRSEFWVGPAGVERRIDGRVRDRRGRLAITAQRLLFTANDRPTAAATTPPGGAASAAAVDVPLGDIAGFAVRGPLLEVQRRSRPADPLTVLVPSPVLVARLVQALVARPTGSPSRPAAAASRPSSRRP
jgi:hypothetical protein